MPVQYIIAIAIAVLLYVFQNLYYKKHWNENLSVEITYNKPYAYVGDTITLTERIINRKRLPLPVLSVKFKTSKTFLFEVGENASISDYYYRNDTFSILGNEQITRTFPFQTSRRGYFLIDNVHLVAGDLFMTSSYACIRENHAALYVYPKRLLQREEMLQARALVGSLLTRNLYDDPLSFRGIRDYTTGDQMRDINWKATAKTSRLQVNTYFDSRQITLCIILNLDTNTMLQTELIREYVLSVATTLLYHTSGCCVRLAANAIDVATGKPLVTETGAGQTHLHTLLQGLSRLNVTCPPANILSFFDGTDSLFTDNQTCYLIVSNYRKQDLLKPCLKKQQKGYPLTFLCPELKQRFSTNDFLVAQPDGTSIPLADAHYWEVHEYET